jgi:hypothetical protein
MSKMKAICVALGIGAAGIGLYLLLQFAVCHDNNKPDKFVSNICIGPGAGYYATHGEHMTILGRAKYVNQDSVFVIVTHDAILWTKLDHAEIEVIQRIARRMRYSEISNQENIDSVCKAMDLWSEDSD